VADPQAVRRLIIEAAREFNAGRYFEAHEVLEDGLEVVPEELWALFVGLIQIAVGYHKVTQELRRGARQMLERGFKKIAAFPPQAAALNLGALRQRVHADIENLRSGTFDANVFVRQPPRLQPLEKN
jgi:predicted metal-dependent hydrolase